MSITMIAEEFVIQHYVKQFALSAINRICKMLYQVYDFKQFRGQTFIPNLDVNREMHRVFFIFFSTALLINA